MVTLQALSSSLNAGTSKRGCLDGREAFGCPLAVCFPRRPRPFAHYRFSGLDFPPRGISCVCERQIHVGSAHVLRRKGDEGCIFASIKCKTGDRRRTRRRGRETHQKVGSDQKENKRKLMTFQKRETARTQRISGVEGP